MTCAIKNAFTHSVFSNTTFCGSWPLKYWWAECYSTHRPAIIPHNIQESENSREELEELVNSSGDQE